MTDFVAYSSRWRIALLTLLAVGFVALGAWEVGAFGVPPRSGRLPAIVPMIIGWSCILFFGACGLILIGKLTDTSEQLRINAAGIRWTRWSDQTIPWAEITDVTIWEPVVQGVFYRQKMLVLHLRDPARFPGGGLSGALAGANRKLTGGDIAISLTGMDCSFAEALSAIERLRPTPNQSALPMPPA